MVRDLRICCVGDSFVAGVGDTRCLGWVGRLGVSAHAAGYAPTLYNLGVRGQTSTDIQIRWLGECERRLPAGSDARVVLSFGVNDTSWDGGGPRVDPEVSQEALTRMLAHAADRDWRVLMVAPPPVDDVAHNERTADLDERFAEICARAAVPYVRVHRALRESALWMREVAEGDGAHPGARGYDLLAELIAPHWREWLSAE
ncbi:GDSL-type esterase/lipase family protein [Nocardia sp. NPDC005366]|uniref:GDSL-type esterase/lipase family protein n=1 Tax=Nocardia sp. NPDC005366 TaxID=3156878 RepID=UPI0033B8D26A